MNDSLEFLENEVSAWLSVPEVAEELDIPMSRVRSLIERRVLTGVRRGEGKGYSVPVEFLMDGRILESLKGTLTLLQDAGYDETESVVWLFTADDSLPGRPIDALRSGVMRTEVRRRAQALAW